MLNEECDICIFIISHKRPDNVQKMQALVGPATWVVAESDVEAYKAAGAANVIVGGKLTPSRNKALQEAFKLGFPCLQLSDDLKKLKQVLFKEDKKETVPLTFEQFVKTMLNRLSKSPYKLAGIAPTFNAFFSNDEVKTKHFVIGDFILVKPSPLRFDEELTLKEDYDFTLQHISTYGGVVRCDDLLAEFQHYSNPGGAVDHRSNETEQRNIAYLKAKWGDAIRDNARRPNEILLNTRKM